MATPLRVLQVEDDPEDALIIQRTLARAGYALDARRVASLADLALALDEPWDVVVADYNLRAFTALDALALLESRGLDLPFLVVSGAIGEELGVTAMLSGAHDYIFKGNLSRLVPAVERELREAAGRRARRAAQEALEAQTRILRSVLDSMADAVVVVDADGRAVLTNRAAERVLGAVPGSASGPWGFHLPDGRTALPEEQGPLARALRGEETRDLELVVRREGGAEGVTVSATGTPLRDESGAVRGGVAVLRDVTERRRAEESARRAEERYLHAQKMEAIGRLAGGVAHDFNNVMSIISNYAALMVRDVPPGDPLAAGLEEIAKAASRAIKLTRQLLTFSYRHDVNVGALDLNAVIVEVEKLLRRLLGEDVELVTSLQPGLGRVRGDAGQLEQVLMNLAVNARDAMPGGGRLTLETREAPGPGGAFVELSVADTGHGMDAQTLSHVFEPFFTTKEAGRGTGLGLATVYGIVTGAGGEVRVESEPGRGTRFRIALPRVEGAAAREPSDVPRPVESDVRGGTETILLVEDDDAVRELTHTVLRRYRYEVIVARNAGEALLLSERHRGPVHLLLTDVVMPYLSGPELVERLAPLRPEMRVVYMSGYTGGHLEGRRDTLDPGIPLVAKPFSVADLARTVRETLDAPRPGGR